jgi:hypothetical protein
MAGLEATATKGGASEGCNGDGHCITEEEGSEGKWMKQRMTSYMTSSGWTGCQLAWGGRAMGSRLRRQLSCGEARGGQRQRGASEGCNGTDIVSRMGKEDK